MKRRLLASVFFSCFAAIWIIRSIGIGTQSPSVTPVDMSGRDYDIQVRELVPENVLIQACTKNFGNQSCSTPIHMLLLGPRYRNETELFSNSDAVPPTHLGTLGFNLGLGEASNCTSSVLAGADIWVSQVLAQAPDGQSLAIAVQRDYYTCLLSTFGENGVNESESVFILVNTNRIYGEVKCSRVSSVKNPNCETTLFDDRGEYSLVMSPLTAKNIRQIIRQANEFAQQFLTRNRAQYQPKAGTLDFPSDVVTWGPETETLILAIESETQ